jgi:hypothetical protein
MTGLTKDVWRKYTAQNPATRTRYLSLTPAHYRRQVTELSAPLQKKRTPLMHVSSLTTVTGHCRGVSTLHLSGSVLVRIYLRTREVDRLRCAFSMGHQKFSICHTFLAPVSSVMASDRPSGDGIAEKTSLRECNSTEALPSRVTFSNVLSPS